MATLSTQFLDRNIPPQQGRMSEDEFIQWCRHEDVRDAEWVNGKVIIKPPIELPHDRLQWWLRNLLEFYVRRKDLGKVCGPQFTCRLAAPSIGVARRNPDIMFVAKDRLNLLHSTYFEGPPNLTIEIVSSESEARDWREKYLEYEAAGVREYWIVDPMSQRVEAYTLTDGKFQVIPEQNGKIYSIVVPNWYVNPQWLWDKDLPDVLEILAELGIK